MNIKDIMSRRVESVTPEARLEEVMKKMNNSDSGCVIVTQDDKLMGIVTERDIAIKCAIGTPLSPESNALQVMTPEVLYCNETDEADTIALNMSKNKVRRLIVLDADKKMVGVVTLGDLAVISNDQPH